MDPGTCASVPLASRPQSDGGLPLFWASGDARRSLLTVTLLRMPSGLEAINTTRLVRQFLTVASSVEGGLMIGEVPQAESSICQLVRNHDGWMEIGEERKLHSQQDASDKATRYSMLMVEHEES